MEEQVQQPVVSAPVDAGQGQSTPSAETHVETPSDASGTVVEQAVDAPKPEANVGDAIRREVERREAQLKKQYEQQMEDVRKQNSYLEKRARQEGFADVNSYLRAIDEYDRQQQIDREAHRMGIDPETYAQYFAPVTQRLSEAEQKLQAYERQITEREQQETAQRQWSELYASFPELAESSQAFNEGKNPDWYTPEMQQLISMGYQPLHAYKLAHQESIISRLQKQTEANTIRNLQQNAESSPGALGAEAPDEQSGYLAMSPAQRKAFREKVKRGEVG